MNRFSISTLLIIGLALPGCANKKNDETENPGSAADANADGDGAPAANLARGTSSTRGPGPRKGGRIKKFAAPKPARVMPLDSPKPEGGETSAIEVTGIVPTMSAGGGVVEVFGTGFVEGVTVKSGEATWEVLEVYEDRVVVKAPDDANGNVTVAMGEASGTSEVPFRTIKGGGFGTPAPTLNGLIGTVSGADGAELGTIAVPNLAVAIEDGAQFGQTDYAITFDGSLNVTTEGEYDLCITSDDGASLYLMETLVIDNSGEHESQEACELVYLEVGEYTIRVDYNNAAATPAAQLALEWSAEGGSLQPIPSDALFRPGR